jgi:hypothetical protein
VPGPCSKWICQAASDANTHPQPLQAVSLVAAAIAARRAARRPFMLIATPARLGGTRRRAAGPADRTHGTPRAPDARRQGLDGGLDRVAGPRFRVVKAVADDHQLNLD